MVPERPSHASAQCVILTKETTGWWQNGKGREDWQGRGTRKESDQKGGSNVVDKETHSRQDLAKDQATRVTEGAHSMTLGGIISVIIEENWHDQISCDTSQIKWA